MISCRSDRRTQENHHYWVGGNDLFTGSGHVFFVSDKLQIEEGALQLESSDGRLGLEKWHDALRIFERLQAIGNRRINSKSGAERFRGVQCMFTFEIWRRTRWREELFAISVVHQFFISVTPTTKTLSNRVITVIDLPVPLQKRWWAVQGGGAWTWPHPTPSPPSFDPPHRSERRSCPEWTWIRVMNPIMLQTVPKSIRKLGRRSLLLKFEDSYPSFSSRREHCSQHYNLAKNDSEEEEHTCSQK